MARQQSLDTGTGWVYSEHWLGTDLLRWVAGPAAGVGMMFDSQTIPG